MHIAKQDVPVKLTAPGAVARQLPGFGDAEGYGEISGEYFSLDAGTDIAPLLQGLGGDTCHSPHWGYLLTGELVVTYLDQPEETCAAGDLFYWPPGHSVRVTADADVVLFSPAQEHTEVLDHMGDKLLGDDGMTALALPHELDDGVDGGAQLQEVVARLGALVAQVRPADLALATPCAGWTTRDLLDHVVGGATMFADAFGGASVRDISGRLPDVVGTDAMAAFEEAAGRFGAAAQQPGAMEQVLLLPWGAMTGRTFLRFVAFDLLVHAWDLATTLEADLDVPEPLVAEIDGFARRVLDGWERDDVNFRAAVPAGPGATATDRLAAFTGRAGAGQ